VVKPEHLLVTDRSKVLLPHRAETDTFCVTNPRKPKLDKGFSENEDISPVTDDGIPSPKGTERVTDVTDVTPDEGKYRLKCIACGKEFSSSRQHAKFCSGACRMKEMRRLKSLEGKSNA
jgi:hypothetical protein